MKLVSHCPSSLVLLDASAVAYTYLKEVTLPEGLMFIQPHAFLKCNNLKKLVCPNVRFFLECACYLRENLEEPSSTRWTSAPPERRRAAKGQVPGPHARGRGQPPLRPGPEKRGEDLPRDRLQESRVHGS